MGSSSFVKSSPIHCPIKSSISYTPKNGLPSSSKYCTHQKYYWVKGTNIAEKSMSKPFPIKENSKGHDLNPKAHSQGVGIPSKYRSKCIPPPSPLPSILGPYVPSSISSQSTYPIPYASQQRHTCWKTFHPSKNITHNSYPSINSIPSPSNLDAKHKVYRTRNPHAVKDQHVQSNRHVNTIKNIIQKEKEISKRPQRTINPKEK